MITNWADKPLAYFAQKTGIPVSEYVPETVGEYYGTGLEVVSDYFTKDWLNAAVKFFSGLLAGGYAVYGKPRDARTKRELVPIANHLLARLLTLSPTEFTNISTSWAAAWAALLRGDFNGFLNTGIKSPFEFQAAFATPRAVTRINNGARATAVVPQTIDVEARPSVGQGRYQITG